MKRAPVRAPRALPALPRTVLGLDLSLTATGVAVVTAQGKLAATETLTSKLRGAERLRDLCDRIAQVIALYEPDDVVAEYYGVDRTRSSSVQTVWLHGAVHLALHAKSMQALYIAPSTLKKWMTGRGAKVEKPEMVAAIERSYGFAVRDHNAAEAAGLAVLGLERARHVNGLESIRGRAFTEYEKGAMVGWQRAFR